MRKLMWVTIGFAAACFAGALGFVAEAWILAVCALVGSILCLVLKRKWLHLRIVAAVLLGLCLGAGWVWGYDLVYMSDAKAADGQIRWVTAEAIQYSYDGGFGPKVEASIRLGSHRYPVLLSLGEEDPARPGDQITGVFELHLTTQTKAGYRRAQGIILVGYPQEELSVRPPQKIPFRHYPAMMRKTLIDTIDHSFPEDTGAFAKALLLGERSDLDAETDTAFKISGISHIVAVSGLHVSILCSLVYLFSRRRRVLTALLGIPVLLLFAAVAGSSPSITRACLMQILMIGALLFDREFDPPTALSFAVLVMLVADPMVIAAASFQLSVGCMVGIFLFSEKLRAWIEGFSFWSSWKGKSRRVRVRTWLSSGISVTLSAMVVTTPMVAYYFGTVSLVGVLTNLLTLWVVSFIFYGVVAVCLLGTLWSWGACGAAWVVSWPIRYVLTVAKLLSKLPLAAVYTASIYIVLWLVLCYVLLAVFLIQRRRKPVVLIGCMVVSLMLAVGLSWLEPLMSDQRITVLDVGQGQCILIQIGRRSYMVDCGGDSDKRSADLAADTLLSQGIGHLDGLIVTHYDRDHAGGVSRFLERISADIVYLPDTKFDDGVMDGILESSDGRYEFVRQDLVLEGDGDRLTVFSPVLATSSNESGLCVLFQGGNCDILITGDLSAVGEELLLRKAQLPKLTALVAGHHGSDSSTSEALLQATRPEYVFISVGAQNPYGHPHDEVVERLEAWGCTVFRTDLNGTIILRR